MLLGFVDSLYLTGQLVGKTFGWLEARDAGIHDETHAGHRQIRFDDGEGGWPQFVLELPADTVFRHASSGPLTRGGGWLSHQTRAEVRRLVEPHLDRFAGRWKTSDHADVFEGNIERDVHVSVRIHEMRSAGTMIVIQQKRSEDRLRTYMKARLHSLRRA